MIHQCASTSWKVHRRLTSSVGLTQLLLEEHGSEEGSLHLSRRCSTCVWRQGWVVAVSPNPVLRTAPPPPYAGPKTRRLHWITQSVPATAKPAGTQHCVGNHSTQCITRSMELNVRLHVFQGHVALILTTLKGLRPYYSCKPTCRKAEVTSNGGRHTAATVHARTPTRAVPSYSN